MNNYCYNIVFQATELNCIFLGIHWKQKSMKKDTLAEIKKNKMKEKKNIKKELGCESFRINLDEKDYAKYIV